MFRYGEMYEQLSNMQESPWLGRIPPFCIFGNNYFVGTYQASCHLIDTGDGLIMIDPGDSNTAYLVVNSIYQLGFKPQDIKFIVNTHWHDDHTGATAAFADLTKAKTLIGRDDMKKAEKFFTPDILVDDGDTLCLGNTTVTFVHTPGHTKGTISLFYDDYDGKNTYRIGMFGGAGANTLVPSGFEYNGCRDDYFKSLERLKKETVDVFIGNHVWNNDTFTKAKILREGRENPFIDKNIWNEFLEFCHNRALTCIKE